MTNRRQSANVYDYPEHLNPFHEEDNHTRLRFWTLTKKKPRSNSFSFQTVKDFRGSISRSFSIRNKHKASNSSIDQTSQIENDDDEVQLRVSPPTRQPTESYSASTRLSVTPLPRSRFHERVRNSENPEPEKPAEKNDSPVSTPSTDGKNPFNDDTDDEKNRLRPQSPSKPVTPARKKKRAPPPPPMRQSSLKAKSLTDYKASKQTEENATTSTEVTISKEVEHLNTNNVNIEIRVEEVILPDDTTEQKEVIENEVAFTEENIKVCDNKVTNSENINLLENEEISPENKIEASEKEQNTPKVSENNVEVPENKQIDSEQNVKEKIVSVNEETNSEEKVLVNDEVILNESNEKVVPEEKEIKVEITKEYTPIEIKVITVESTLVSNSNSNDETSSVESIPIPDNEEIINYNSDITLSSSNTSLCSETKLEHLQQEEAKQDTSDLLELVTKLKMEVDKLTDDTNNNIIETDEERKARNIESWIKIDSPSKVKTEVNDDDDDVVCSAPMSPKLVRLRKDNDWIRRN